MSSSIISFPSRASILSYLEQHPLTNDRYYKEKRILEAVAKAFADQKIESEGVSMGLFFPLYGERKRLGLSDATLRVMSLSLTKALLDCANGKPLITLKKSEEKSEK